VHGRVFPHNCLCVHWSRLTAFSRLACIKQLHIYLLLCVVWSVESSFPAAAEGFTVSVPITTAWIRVFCFLCG
jgi:hypothetical protein